MLLKHKKNTCKIKKTIRTLLPRQPGMHAPASFILALSVSLMAHPPLKHVLSVTIVPSLGLLNGKMHWSPLSAIHPDSVVTKKWAAYKV